MTTPAAKVICSKKIWRGFESYPCKLGGKVERGGKWFCGIHDPDAVEKRRKRSMDEFHAKMEAQAKNSRLRAAAPALADALEEMLARYGSSGAPEVQQARAALTLAGRRP